VDAAPVGPVGPIGPTFPTEIITKINGWLLAKFVVPVPAEPSKVTGNKSHVELYVGVPDTSHF
jgi:hypothetical protein